jgi:signal transduction histidine kinase
MCKSESLFSAPAATRRVSKPRMARRTVPTAAFVFWCLAISTPTTARAENAIEGLPLTRFYPFEEIGNVSRGAHLNFDIFGRIAVLQRGAYVVLNDSTWLDLAETDPDGIRILEAKSDGEGRTYYSALGSWGVLTGTATGKMRPNPLVPPECPKWARAVNFDQILCTNQGVYFAGVGGVVFWDRHAKRHRFFEFSGFSRIFSFGGAVYVSSHSKGVLFLDVDQETLVKPERNVFGNTVVGRFASAGSDRAIVATTFRRLLILRDGEIQPLPPPLAGNLPGNVTALEQLPEGGVAASVAGDGLYILDRDGKIETKLTGPEYARVTALASNEVGVLWVATETGVIKILHGLPLTVFGQSLGLPVDWPQLVLWDERLIVASGGRLYETIAVPPGEPTRFQQIRGQPGAGAWGIATVGSSLLVGNGNGVFVRQPGGGFVLAVGGIDVARIVVVDSLTCIVIGADEIGALRLQDGIWAECAPRVRGFGYPFIVHRGKNSAWIELGVNRVARISVASNRLETRVFDSFPWARPNWVSVSVLGSTVALTGADNKRIFYDENTQTVGDAPVMRALLDQSPHPVQRICEDDAGTLWGSYERGILKLRHQDGRPTVYSTSYGAIDEQSPLVQPLPGGDIWVSSGQSLYHLDRKREQTPAPRLRPLLTLASDSRTHAELLQGGRESASLSPLPYSQNSLTFAFFAGSYFLRRPPAYQFQLNDESWQPVASGSSLALSDLHEGDYRLKVRLADSRGPIGTPWHLDFSVAPPWYRTWLAIAAYPLLAAAILFGLVRFSLRRAKARTAALEKTVVERTKELQTTMDKLQRETRTSATLAERNRLAGEIHDSLEQGFTGLTLQLATMANFAASPEMKNGLVVALNMVAFSRDEVRHAVQNLHSPVLESADLTTALKQIVAQTAPSPGYATITTEGAPRPLSSAVEHHLLRIAQEAITNTVKHASASHLEIVLAFEKSAVHLTIRDDGHGFDPNAVLNGGRGHFGLPSFRGRANKIGGTVEIISQPGAGTRIVVHVPLGSESSPQV